MYIFYVSPTVMNYITFQGSVSPLMERHVFGYLPQLNEDAKAFAQRMLVNVSLPDAFVIEHELASEEIPIDFSGWDVAKAIQQLTPKPCFVLTRDKAEIDPRFFPYPETDADRQALAERVEAQLPAYTGVPKR